MEAAAKKRHPLRIVAWTLGIALALAVAAVVALNIYVRVAFGPFYDQAERVFDIPGVNAGFVCQDLDHLETTDAWLFSGYMADHSPSPLYRRDADGAVARLTVTLPDGDAFAGHGSAITSTDRYAYLACEGGYLVLDAEEVASAADGQVLGALAKVELDFSPAFMNIEGGTLYAGNFYFPGDYETPGEHRIVTADGTENPAVMYAYPADAEGAYGFAEQAARVYSIPAMVQGMAITDEGQLVLSTSYGLRSSHLLGYDLAALNPEGTFQADGATVPLYVLDSRSQVADVEAPPMTEGIESHGGKVYVSEESACNKYIFGKLYGAGYVYALEV